MRSAGPEASVTVRLARPEDLATYAEMGRVAQARLRAGGLEQYVPAAHDESAPAIRDRIAAGTLYAVEEARGRGVEARRPTSE